MRCIIMMHINPTTTCYLKKLATVVFCSGSSLNLNMDNWDRDGGKKQNPSKIVGCYIQCYRHTAATNPFSRPRPSHQQ